MTWEAHVLESIFNNQVPTDADSMIMLVQALNDHFPYFEWVAVSVGADGEILPWESWRMSVKRRPQPGGWRKKHDPT
jgi:hypothetical protein